MTILNAKKAVLVNKNMFERLFKFKSYKAAEAVEIPVPIYKDTCPIAEKVLWTDAKLVRSEISLFELLR